MISINGSQQGAGQNFHNGICETAAGCSHRNIAGSDANNKEIDNLNIDNQTNGLSSEHRYGRCSASVRPNTVVVNSLLCFVSNFRHERNIALLIDNYYSENVQFCARQLLLNLLVDDANERGEISPLARHDVIQKAVKFDVARGDVLEINGDGDAAKRKYQATGESHAKVILSLFDLLAASSKMPTFAASNLTELPLAPTFGDVSASKGVDEIFTEIRQLRFYLQNFASTQVKSPPFASQHTGSTRSDSINSVTTSDIFCKKRDCDANATAKTPSLKLSENAPRSASAAPITRCKLVKSEKSDKSVEPTVPTYSDAETAMFPNNFSNTSPSSTPLKSYLFHANPSSLLTPVKCNLLNGLSNGNHSNSISPSLNTLMLLAAASSSSSVSLANCSPNNSIATSSALPSLAKKRKVDASPSALSYTSNAAHSAGNRLDRAVRKLTDRLEAKMEPSPQSARDNFAAVSPTSSSSTLSSGDNNKVDSHDSGSYSNCEGPSSNESSTQTTPNKRTVSPDTNAPLLPTTSLFTYGSGTVFNNSNNESPSPAPPSYNASSAQIAKFFQILPSFPPMSNLLAIAAAAASANGTASTINNNTTVATSATTATTTATNVRHNNINNSTTSNYVQFLKNFAAAAAMLSSTSSSAANTTAVDVNRQSEAEVCEQIGFSTNANQSKSKRHSNESGSKVEITTDASHANNISNSNAQIYCPYSCSAAASPLLALSAAANAAAAAADDAELRKTASNLLLSRLNSSLMHSDISDSALVNVADDDTAKNNNNNNAKINNNNDNGFSHRNNNGKNNVEISSTSQSLTNEMMIEEGNETDDGEPNDDRLAMDEGGRFALSAEKLKRSPPPSSNDSAENDVEKPFACTHVNCHKRFTNKFLLKKHQFIHTGLRPHACPYCSKRFNRKDNLLRHKKTHLANGEEGVGPAAILNGCRKRHNMLYGVSADAAQLLKSASAAYASKSMTASVAPDAKCVAAKQRKQPKCEEEASVNEEHAANDIHALNCAAPIVEKKEIEEDENFIDPVAMDEEDAPMPLINFNS